MKCKRRQRIVRDTEVKSKKKQKGGISRKNDKFERKHK
jgi:hypothetical protein